MSAAGPDIATSALIVVDMQNDFVSEGGYFDRLAKKHPERGIDREFLASTIPQISRLVEGFRLADRPVLYVKHVLDPTTSTPAFPTGVCPIIPDRSNPNSSLRERGGRKSSRS